MGSKWALRWPQACQLKYFWKLPTENKDPTYFYLSPRPFDKQWTRISQEEAYLLNTMLTLWVAPAFGKPASHEVDTRRGGRPPLSLPSRILEIKTNRHLLFRLAFVIGFNGAATCQLWNELRAFQTSCRWTVTVEPLCRGHPRDQGQCPLNGDVPLMEVGLGVVSN